MRFSFDRTTGDLWIGDVGMNRREEVDRAEAGADGARAGRGQDFGWSRCEGSLELFDDEGDDDIRCDSGAVPVFDYEHGTGACAVIGGHVYRGPDAPEWQGLYLAADYCGRLFALDAEGAVRYSSLIPQRLSTFGEDADGHLFAADGITGEVYRIDMVGPPAEPGHSRMPRS